MKIEAEIKSNGRTLTTAENDIKCNASAWLKTKLGPRFTSKLDEADTQLVSRAIRQNFMILKGQKYVTEEGVYNGKPFTSYYLPEIHDLNLRHEVYPYTNEKPE